LRWRRRSSRGKNIVDAAEATKDTLDSLVLSVLTDSPKWSKGKITWNYHFEGKWKIVEYSQKTYPELYKKTSFFQPAFFMTNLESQMTPHKISDDAYGIAFPVDGNKKIPMYHPRQDTGPLVKALFSSPQGRIYWATAARLALKRLRRFGARILERRSSISVLLSIIWIRSCLEALEGNWER
jgi:hypothetical protein